MHKHAHTRTHASGYTASPQTYQYQCAWGRQCVCACDWDRERQREKKRDPKTEPHPNSAVIIVSMTMRHARRISCGPDKQWSFTKTRRSLQQLVKSMPSVSKLIKTSPLSSDTPSIAAGAQCSGGWGGGGDVCGRGGFVCVFVCECVRAHLEGRSHAHIHTPTQTHAQYSDDWSEIPISQGAEVD